MKQTKPSKLRLGILLSLLISLSSFAGWLYYGEANYFSPQPSFDDALYVPVEPDNVVSLENFDSKQFPGHLVDPNRKTGIFSEKLQRMSESLRDVLGIDIHIVIARLDENNIGVQAEKLFQLRDIGRTVKTGGILILVDSGRKEVKIEVSHSLEGVLTDSTVGLIAKNQLAPYTSYNAIGMALMDTLHYIKNYLYLASLQGRLLLDERFTSTRDYAEKSEILSGGAGAFATIKDINFDQDWKRRLSRTERQAYLPSNDPMKSAEAFIRVLKNLIGDPTLDLFTNESNIMRSYYPVAPFEYLARYREFVKSRPLRVIQEGDYAVVSSANPSHAFAPILLKRVDNLWRIDTVELWKNIFFNGEGKNFLHNANMPYTFGLAQFGMGEHWDIAALDIPSTSLQQNIEKLKEKNTALSHFQLGEIYFRNTFTALAALDHYEQAVKLAPNDPLFAETLADRYLYLYFPDAAIPLLKKQGRVAFLKLTKAYALTGDYVNAEKIAKQVLEANPYSMYALRWLAWLMKKQNKQAEYARFNEKILALQSDPDARANFVWLTFQPVEPDYITSNTVQVGKTTVYGHSDFSILMENHSGRDVIIKRIIFYSRGDRRTSGLGDIKDYFTYPIKNRILPAGESVTFHKVWGFTVPVPDRNMTYDFDLCWQGVNDSLQQCETQRLFLKAEGI